MPPLTRGKCGVPSSEISTQRLPPQSVPLHRQPVEAGVGAKADRLELAAHRLDEAGLGDLVDAAFGLGRGRSRRRPAGRPRWPPPACASRPSCSAVRSLYADPARAALDAARDALPVDAVEQPGQAVAAARGQRDRSAARRRRGGARRAGPRRRRRSAATCASAASSISTVEAERGQPLCGAAQRRGRAQHAGRGEQGAATSRRRS